MRTRLSLLAGAAMALALPAAAADRALVVGIDYYPDVDLTRPLTHARADAVRFREHLIANLGFAAEDITLLIDEGATSDALIDALFDKLVAETAPGDRAVFYFAGLGARVQDPDVQEADGFEEVLLMHDAGTPRGQVPESAISDALDLIADRAVTVVVDASLAAAPVLRGGGDEAPRGLDVVAAKVPTRAVQRSDQSPPGQQTFEEPPFASGDADRDVWAAAAPSQVAWEGAEGGVFTTAFIQGAGEGQADLNANGAVSNAELLSFIRDKAEAFCQNSAACSATGLGLAPDFSGDVMGTAAKVAAAVPQTPAPTATDATPPAPQPAPTVVERPAPVPAGAVATPVTPAANPLGFASDLFAPNNDANLRLSMIPQKTLQIGDFVSFEVKSDRPGTLLLLDVNPNGELHQIFPSALSKEGVSRIMPVEALFIPEPESTSGRPLRIRVTEPAGQGFLLALLVETDAPAFEALLPENLTGAPIPNAEQYLYGLAQDLLALQAGPEGNRAVEWSATYLTYEILP